MHRIIETLSAERFATYLKAAGHEPDRALRFYIWNAQIGEAFHMPIQAAEVALRNKINRGLIEEFDYEWWRNSRFQLLLDRERASNLKLVVRRLENRGAPLVAGHVVAGLSFGFWTGLLQRRYNPSLWGRQLRCAFPHLPADVDRDTLFRKAASTAALRNRISHHEPIFHRDLTQDYASVMRLVGWICPATHDWIRPHCRVPTLLRAKP